MAISDLTLIYAELYKGNQTFWRIRSTVEETEARQQIFFDGPNSM